MSRRAIVATDLFIFSQSIWHWRLTREQNSEPSLEQGQESEQKAKTGSTGKEQVRCGICFFWGCITAEWTACLGKTGGKYAQYVFTCMLYYILLHAQVIVSLPTNYPLPIFSANTGWRATYGFRRIVKISSNYCLSNCFLSFSLPQALWWMSRTSVWLGLSSPWTALLSQSSSGPQ